MMNVHLLESSRLDLLNEWQTEIDQEYKTKSDLDWIFSHGPEVLIAAHGASIKTLSLCIGGGNLWGDRSWRRNNLSHKRDAGVDDGSTVSCRK